MAQFKDSLFELFDVLRQGYQVCGEQATPIVVGPTGIGKSVMIKEYAEKRGLTPIADFRLAQLETAAELVGNPIKRRLNGDILTDYAPPYRIHKAKTLFFDEINRARPDVLQAVFQAILDRSLGGYEFANDVWIVCAQNPTTDEYEVGEMDVALTDRLCWIMAPGPTVSEWVEWMGNKEYPLPEYVADFMSDNPPVVEVSENPRKSYTYRSMTKFALCAAMTNNPVVVRMMARGFLGDIAAQRIKLESILSLSQLMEGDDKKVNKYLDTMANIVGLRLITVPRTIAETGKDRLSEIIHLTAKKRMELALGVLRRWSTLGSPWNDVVLDCISNGNSGLAQEWTRLEGLNNATK